MKWTPEQARHETNPYRISPVPETGSASKPWTFWPVWGQSNKTGCQRCRSAIFLLQRRLRSDSATCFPRPQDESASVKRPIQFFRPSGENRRLAYFLFHVFRRLHIVARIGVDKAEVVVNLLDAGGIFSGDD